MIRIVLALFFFGAIYTCTPSNTEETAQNLDEENPNAGLATEPKREIVLDSSIPPFDENKAERILTGFFEKFGEEDFTALQDYFTPEVERFITLENIKANEVSSVSRAFFKGKEDVQYKPDFSRFGESQDTQNGAYITKLPLEMTWNEQDPNFDQKGIYQKRIVTVWLELKLNKSYKILSYIEKDIIKPKFRLLQAYAVEDKSHPDGYINIPKGTILQDNFYRRSGGAAFEQFQLLYKGKAYWIPEFDAQMGGAVRLLEKNE